MKEQISFLTPDGVKIIGDYYRPIVESKKAALLLHMMPSDRSSWDSFAPKLHEKGYHVLAIDLRGHGESKDKQGGLLDYKNFNDKAHQSSRLDVESAINFLKEKGVSENQLTIIGASIGANLALEYQANNSIIKTTVLLSPGLDYRGVRTEEANKKILPSNAVFYVASREDSYSAETIEKLYQAASCKKDLRMFENSGHGTTIFETNPDFKDEVVKWIEANM